MAHVDLLYKRVKEYLDSQDWKYTTHDEKHIIDFGMNIDCKLKSCKVFIKCSDRAISCYAICPLNADEDTRPVVAEYLTRANYGLNNGNFEMDYSDGEIRYKTYMLCSQHVPDIREVEVSVDLSFMMMKRYGNGLAKAIMGFGEPEKDIAEAEKD